MQQTAKKLVAFLKKEDGPTAVEYAVMLALIIVVCIAAITTLGSNANNTFSSVAEKAAPAVGIGRASWRGRVQTSVVAVSLKKKRCRRTAGGRTTRKVCST